MKTWTLINELLEPSITLCPGHVDAETFNVAYAAEGWVADPISQEDLRHEWWRKVDDYWHKSEEGAEHAQAVTVNYWEAGG